jgi:hypothetical protein
MAMTVHLNERLWQELQADPQAHAELVAHLATPCDACEAFLGGQLDELDGAADAALLKLSPAQAPALDELAFRRVMNRVKAPPRRASWVTGLSIAAGLVLGVVAWRAQVATAKPELLKGSTNLELELSAALTLPDGTAQPVEPRMLVPSSGTLVFRTHANEPVPATVWVQREGKAPEPLAHVSLEAGTQELKGDAGLVGFSLDGEHGDLRIWVVAGSSRSPLEVERALESSPSAGAVSGVSVQVR